MNYRPKLLIIFFLLLGVIFYMTIGYAQAKIATSTEQSITATNTEKTSSSNIHFDEIVIKSFPSPQSGNSAISEDNQKILALKLSNDAQENFISWIKRQWWITESFGIAVLIAFIVSIVATIKLLVQLAVEKHVSKTIEATIKATLEIEKTQKALDELQNTEKELNKKLKDFRSEIDEETKKYDLIKINLDSTTIKFEERITDEIYVLEQKINLLKLIINKIDKDGAAKDQVIDELIVGLDSDVEKIKFSAAELLPQFELESSKISDAFVKILKNSPDTTFESLLLSGLSELRGDSKTLVYLLEAVDDLSNPNILAIIGALGKIGENGKTKITDIELESIIDKLLLILNSDLDNKEDNKEFSDDTITASNVRGAIALALSCYGDKAGKAVKDLITLLMDQESETRKNAVIALGRIGIKAKGAISALRKLKDDEYMEVREATSDAIEEILKTA